MDAHNFSTAFKLLTDRDPLPWQRRLYEERFAKGEFSLTARLPTGLGKTMVLAVWLIALANKIPNTPRRLVYVVNRRTVVDQTTREAEKLHKTASLVGVNELAISTLRGQFADNRLWSADPSRPAIICGTVDMIGSRLLFSGYGCGFKTRPMQAGFLGQDALIVHDEAHLEPAFQKLITDIRAEQQRDKDALPIEVLELSATARGEAANTFTLNDEDHANATVKERYTAPKALTLKPEEAKLPEQLAALAKEKLESNEAILVFASSVEHAKQVANLLEKAKKGSTITLTGTMRGHERESLIRNRIFQRFLHEDDRAGEVATGTVFLVCTSAGEVGVNISADHLICDLTPFDSMAQRFGRVNRFGKNPNSTVTVVIPSKYEEKSKLSVPREATAKLLATLGDVSPRSLDSLPAEARMKAFTPTPVLLDTSDILFDAWALTTITDKLPGRPPVEPYLHGIAEWEPPQTSVAWREEVERVSKALDQMASNRERSKFAAALLEDFPLKPHEILKDRTDRVYKELEKLDEDQPVWLVDVDDRIELFTALKWLLSKDKEYLEHKTVLLPPGAGGLTENGQLDGSVKDKASDVCEAWLTDKDEPRRARIWDDADVPPKMRWVRTIDTRPGEGDDESEVAPDKKLWHWYVRPRSADDDGSKSAIDPVPWEHHTRQVTEEAERIARELTLSEPLQAVLRQAGLAHDLGKKRRVWQRSIGNIGKDWLAKSGRGMKPLELTDYRHEFGSLMEIVLDDIPLANRDLVLHLIAVHHGYGRPHFPADRAFDPEPQPRDPAAVAAEVPIRFARLQRTFGRWGLAYVESLLRAADYKASSEPKTYPEGSR